MKAISKGTADFEYIRKENALYVDKTEYLWNLISQKSKEFFLARPRRFGKSLTLSTLKAIFQGKKELFNGLAIDKCDYSWEQYPVIHLDFCDYENMDATPNTVQADLIERLKQTANANGISFDCDYTTAGKYFTELIQKMSVEKPVVILIDEYDKMITENLDHKDISKIRDVLAGFYSVLKKIESRVRFLFMTGVTKFSQVSVFSKLNNLTDISNSPDYSTMLGYTQDELEFYFGEYLQLAAKHNEMDLPFLKEKVKQWYNGFRFSTRNDTVYNPVSIASFFTNGYEFRNYWFSTGSPSMLMHYVSGRQVNIIDALNCGYDSTFFEAFDVENVDPIVLLNQTGYLTISKVVETAGEPMFYLNFPNKEVRGAFYRYLLDYYVGKPKSAVRGFICDLERATATGDVDKVISLMNIHLAGIPNRIKLNDEKYYQTIFVSLFMVLGYDIVAESSTYDGYIDAVMLNGDWCFIFEFKLDKSASVAMDQIKQKEYYRKYLSFPQRIMLVGANFDSEKGLLTNIQTEQVDK